MNKDTKKNTTSTQNKKAKSFNLFSAKDKRLKELITEATELISIYNTKNDINKPNQKRFGEGEILRITAIYEELEKYIKKSFLRREPKLARHTINIMETIAHILKGRDLELDDNSKKKLKKMREYLDKIEYNSAGSPVEIYTSVKNKANNIMDKGLTDEDSLTTLSILLEQMREAYSEDSGDGGEGKLFVGECLKDFKTIEEYIDRARNGKSVGGKDISEQIDDLKDNIKNMLPQDDKKFDTLLSPIGTTERAGEEKLVEMAKEVNSSHKVAMHIKVMRVLGTIGLIVALGLGVMGISFDIEYHLPKLHPFLVDEFGFLGSLSFWALVVFMAMLVTSLLHIPIEAYVNKKWSKRVRKYLLYLLIFSVPASLYIDYRAVQNYAKLTASTVIDKQLNNSNNKLGAIATQQRREAEARQKEVERFQKNIDKLSARNDELYKKIDDYQSVVDRIDKKKRRTRKDNTLRWRTIQKIKSLKVEIEGNKNEINMLEGKINATKKYESSNSQQLVKVAEEADKIKAEEARNRAIMMYVLVALIHASSFLKVYGDFLNNKNLPIDIDLVHEFNASMNANQLFARHSRLALAQMNIAGDKLLELDRFAFNASFANQLQGQASQLQNNMLLGEVIRKNNENTQKLLGNFLGDITIENK